MERPKHRNVIDVDSNYAIDLNKYIDQLEAEKKAMISRVQVNILVANVIKWYRDKVPANSNKDSITLALEFFKER